MGAGLDLWGLCNDGSEFPADIALSPFETPDGFLIVCAIRTLSERLQLQSALAQQIAFERLVTDISARMAHLRSDGLDEEITRALQQITEFLSVDQAAWLSFSREQGSMFATHYYNAPGVGAPPPPPILHTQFQWYTAKLGRGEIVHFEDLPDDLPPEAAQEREHVTATGMKGHLAIPINVGGSMAFVLAIVFFHSSRPLPRTLIPRLQLLGEIFASALVRKSTYQTLEESEAKFRLLAETATCGVGIYQGDRFCYVNPRATEITGYSADELLSLGVECLVHPDFRPLVLERAQARLRGETVPNHYEIKILTKRGEERWVDFTSTVAQYRGHPAIIGTAFDITERKEVEANLQELSGRLIQAQEEERSRIARELHDDLSQRLALVTIGLEELSLRDASSTSNPQLQAISSQSKEIAAEIHNLSRQLHPSQLEVLGLVAAVQSFCTEISRQKGLRIDLVHDGVPRGLPSEVRLCLYRVVQEALQNVCKHSGADQVRIELTGTPEAVSLVIVDRGRGFDPKATGTGLGLVSMRERVRLVRGELSIDSRPGGGTKIQVRAPLPAPIA